MLVNIPDNGLVLESPTKMAGLPAQAFAVTLSDSAIEDMIKRVQNGEGIQLSLGENPAFLLRDRDINIHPEPLEYDLFRSTSPNPTSFTRLPQPAMSIFSASRHKKAKPTKAVQPKATKTDKPAARPSAPKASSATPRLGAVPDKDAGAVEEDEALANLKNTYARAEAEKRQLAERRGKASAALGNNLLTGNGKGGKGKPGKTNLLRPQPVATSRSQPSSPGFGALASPSILSTVNSAQDRAKQQRFPIIHELAVQELSFNQLLAKVEDVNAEELTSLLKKVADFDDGLQKWALKKLYWKELDVFQYKYDQEEDRQKAIDNAIKVYDRTRIGSSDPLWQKLLPEAERNKGICLSKLQATIAAIASDAAARRQRTATPGMSGADSERDDSANSGAKKGKGSEAMSRSSSQSQTEKKATASKAKKPTPAAAKAAPKAAPKAPTKLASNTKVAPAKPGRAPLSKEFVTSSDDEDEAPLSKAKGAAAPASTSTAKPAARTAEKAKLPERKEPLAPKAKPAPAPAVKPSAGKRRDEERGTIRAQAPVRPTKAPAKRQREEDEDNDSSTSSTAPLSKRLKPAAKAQSAPAPAVKQRASSEATQASRTNSSALAKSKNTSPVKSSPLVVSPPTNASELETDRPATARDTDRGRVRDREHERDTIVSRAGSNRTTSSGTTSSSGGDSGNGNGGRAATNGKKRGAEDQSLESKTKRQRLSEVVLNKAHAFKKFYTRYEALHRELSTLRDPPSEQINNLLEMRERLQEMKQEIYREAPVEV